MTRIERRWTHAILMAFAPPGGPGLSPQPGEVDYLGTFAHMRAGATRKAALGLRFAVLLVGLSPIIFLRRLRSIASLSLPERTALLQQLLSHRLFAIRELTLLLKFTAAMALLGQPEVRARSGYDLVQPSELSESGLRVRRSLPLLPAATGADTESIEAKDESIEEAR